jgi:hypothetical protein
VRYPNTNFDYSRASLDRFRTEIEKTLDVGERDALAMQADLDPLTFAANFQDRFAQFQRQQVTDLVERV